MQQIQTLLNQYTSSLPADIQTRPLMFVPRQQDTQELTMPWGTSELNLPFGSEDNQALSIIERLSNTVQTLLQMVSSLIGL
ncbi:MAG: hypothetical protein KDD62_02965, partial [Bdellovibrionales bacterium]|nr:hypothetical protein [Bdellovibrionales bacterium]